MNVLSAWDVPSLSLPTTAMLAFALAAVLQPVVLRLMSAAAIVDVPTERSSHTVPTPRGGGIAIVIAAATAFALCQPARALAVAILAFAAIGLLDDIRGASVRTRVLLLAVAGTAVSALLLPGGAAPAIWATQVALAALWLTAYVNAFNFMDGINGMSAVQSIVAGGVYAAVGLTNDLPLLAVGGCVLAVGCATFLPYNAGKARIFLGDVGSYGLGGLIGAIALYALSHGVPPEAAAAPLVVYLADTGWTLARRVVSGQAWYRPHRTHVYQRLTSLGWSHQRVTVLVAAWTALISGCLFAASQATPVSRLSLDVVAVELVLAYLAAPWWLAGRPGTLRTQTASHQSAKRRSYA